MWRIFRKLDDHKPGFYKFTIMTAGLSGMVLIGFLLFLLHTAAGVIYAMGFPLALLRASHVYRFHKKPKGPAQSTLPISEASADEILRRVRRSERTERWRRHILQLAAQDLGPRGDIARRIVERWKAAGSPDGRPTESKPEDPENDEPRS